MPAAEDRLTRVETEVGFLKGSFDKIERALMQLADDMHRMAVAEAERAEDRKALDRVFAQLKGFQDEQKDIRSLINKVVADASAMELKRANDELRSRNHWIGELGRTGLAVGGALVLYHFGVRPL